MRCWSVGRSVGRSVCRSVGNAFTFSRFLSCLCIWKSFRHHQKYLTIIVLFVNQLRSERKRTSEQTSEFKRNHVLFLITPYLARNVLPLCAVIENKSPKS